MKRFTRFAAMLFAAAILLGFAGCKKDADPKPVYYTVSFDTDGAGDVASQKVEEGKTATKPEDPTKTGYTFGGWYNGEAAFDFATPVTADTSLKAKWTANTYTITLQNGDGADPATKTITVTYGQKIADLTATDIPAKTGLVFGGYYTEQLAEGTKFIDKDGKGCEVWKFTEDKTIYAAFGYTITYNNTKNVNNPNPDVYYEGKGLASLAALDGTDMGYAFDGWSATDGGEVISGTAVSVTDVTAKEFFAKWTPIEYTITYEGLDGASNPNVATYTVETSDITLQNIANCYLFDGWYDAASGGNKVETILHGSIGNRTLYAHGVILGKKANPNAVGDIVFSNGRACAYSDELILDDNAGDKAVAVIFYIGGNDTIGQKILGVGLEEAQKQWATADATYYNSTVSNAKNDGNGAANTNAIIGLSDSSEAKYPAAWWAHNYSVTGFENGWYLPAKLELEQLRTSKKETVNNSIKKIEGKSEIGGSDDAKNYWSSTQHVGSGATYFVQAYYRASRTAGGGDKKIYFYCRAIREF